MVADVARGGYAATLLKGVTGSGKTEVYLEAVAECLRSRRQALVLLPEIASVPVPRTVRPIVPEPFWIVPENVVLVPVLAEFSVNVTSLAAADGRLKVDDVNTAVAPPHARTWLFCRKANWAVLLPLAATKPEPPLNVIVPEATPLFI